MHRLAVSTILFFAATSVVSGQPPCNSQLRLALPQFFTHCSCEYSEWSEWIGTSVINVPTHQCASGEAINERRRQTVIGVGCSERTATRQICAPELVDRLILALGLGSSGQHISPTFSRPGVPLRPNGLPAPVRPAPAGPSGPERPAGPSGPVQYENPEPVAYIAFTVPPIPEPIYFNPIPEARQICHHLTSDRGKRSLQKEQKVNIRKPDKSKPYLKPLENDPIPFDMNLHGSRYRRQTTCYPDDTQYILFMLDTSGSIGRNNFEEMTSTLGQLVSLFCRPIRIGVMTFNHEYYVEFCFNSFDNTCHGRSSVRNAINQANYRSGSTHTGGAVQCACDFMLSTTCGLPPDASCIDVVVITDGHSNGPRPVCHQVRCLHNRYGVNTFAIGIGNADQNELDCISDYSDPTRFNLFNFDSFAEFQSTLNELIILLTTLDPLTNTYYTCVDPQTALGRNSCG